MRPDGHTRLRWQAEQPGALWHGDVCHGPFLRVGQTTKPRVIAAFAEARYLAWTSVEDDQTFPVKGHHLSASALLGNEELARDFTGGPLLLARLCPVHYHRFHRCFL